MLPQASNQLEIDQLTESELPRPLQGLARHRSQHAPLFLMQELRVGAQQRSASGCVEQAHQQAVFSRMPPSALLCCSGLRAQWANEVKVGAGPAPCAALKSGLEFPFDDQDLRRGD